MLQSRSSLIPMVLMCVGSILIGCSAVFVRLSDLGPMTTGFYRMLFALPFLAMWMKWERAESPPLERLLTKDMVGLALAGAFFALDLALWNWSIDHTTIVNSTLFNNTAAFFVPLILWVVFGEKQSLRFILATLTGFSGCVFLIGESFTISFETLLGDIIALLSGVLVALYLITLQRIRDRVSTGFLMFWTGGFSLVFLALFSYLSGEAFWPLTVKDVLSVLGQAILIHTIGQSLLAYSLGRIPATYAALILFLAPVTGAILGWVFYAESLSFVKLFGMALIMVSIVAVKKKN